MSFAVLVMTPQVSTLQVSHSSVQLPVDSFLRRISRLASDVHSIYLRSLPSDVPPEHSLQVRCPLYPSLNFWHQQDSQALM